MATALPATLSADDQLTELYQSAAKEILDRSGQRTGYCLVVGSEQGRLAYELAQQSELTVIGVEPDADKAAASRAGTRASRDSRDARHDRQCAAGCSCRFRTTLPT